MGGSKRPRFRVQGLGEAASLKKNAKESGMLALCLCVCPARTFFFVKSLPETDPHLGLGGV